ncbi:MAG: NACHT domain-containing protein [Rivularia sp. (in: cyanobacteria)]
MGAIKVNKIIFEQLRQAYSERFGASPTSLISRLNQIYKLELENPEDDLISDRTIRGFFNSSHPPNMLEKNLNFLCFVLLDFKSYCEAVDVLINEDSENYTDSLEPYWKYLDRKCSTMKVLDMTEPVNLDSIYVKFNILKDIRGKQNTIEQLFSDLESDTTGILKRLPFISNENQLSGLEAVNKYQKLLILGKPGAGKTTFLKHLAIHSNLKDSTGRLIPVFIQLKQYCEDDKNQNLIDAIIEEFTIYLPNFEQNIRRLLEKGHCLIMLDGLDEVKTDNHNIYQDIDNLIKSFPDNRYIITSRTGACDYVFADFTEVEAADFGWEEVKYFAYNWFGIRHERDTSHKFIQQLQENESVKELAANPLLLTILCFTFEDTYGFTKNRYGLYTDAVDSLLRRWDASRRIDRNPHLKISRQRKTAMFSEIAYEGLNQNPPKISWQKWELEEKISAFVESISFEVDTQDILREIEANYGLLTQQARSIYSFSHLTFQEYFAAEYIVENRETISLENFVKQNLTKKQWQEVFILLSERLNKANAENFIKWMFEYTNKIVESSQKIQALLEWLQRITDTAGVNSSSWRAFYLTIDLDVDLYISHDIQIDRIGFSKLSTQMREFNQKRKKITKANAKTRLISGLAGILTLAVAYAESNVQDKDNNYLEPSDFTKEILKIYPQSDINEKITFAIDKAKESHLIELATELSELQNNQPETSDDTWEEWSEKLRLLMLKHLDIGHKINFVGADIKALEEYIYANCLLLKCIRSDNNISTYLREQIIDNLLLPNYQTCMK